MKSLRPTSLFEASKEEEAGTQAGRLHEHRPDEVVVVEAQPVSSTTALRQHQATVEDKISKVKRSLAVFLGGKNVQQQLSTSLLEIDARMALEWTKLEETHKRRRKEAITQLRVQVLQQDGLLAELKALNQERNQVREDLFDKEDAALTHLTTQSIAFRDYLAKRDAAEAAAAMPPPAGGGAASHPSAAPKLPTTDSE